ncbi:MAG: TetR/AcrR family transcriptional regulator [Sphingomonadales bacterium]
MNAPHIAPTTRDRILNAAERLFARRGFYGVTIRQITREAGVDVALASYYFGPKADMFRAVLERRAGELHGAILHSLNQVADRTDGKPPSIETLIRAFTQPSIDRLVRGGEGWRDYIHLMADLYTSQQSEFLVAMHEMYLPALGRFMELAGRSIPTASERGITLSFYMLLTAVIGIYSEAAGLRGLARTDVGPTDFEAILDHLAPFFAAGFHRMASV